MAEELVELLADLHDLCGRLFRDDHVRDFVAVCLPVGFRDAERASFEVGAAAEKEGEAKQRDSHLSDDDGLRLRGRRGCVLLHLESLEDEDRLAHVAVRVRSDELHRLFGYREPFPLPDKVQHGLHLITTHGGRSHVSAPAFCCVSLALQQCERARRKTHLIRTGRGDAHEETPGADRRDELAGAVRAEDETHVRHVLLHRPAQRRLRVARERVRFVDHHNLRARVDNPHDERGERERQSGACMGGQGQGRGDSR